MLWVMVLALSVWPGPTEPPGQKEPPFAAKFAEIKAAMDKLNQEGDKLYQAARTEEEKEAVIGKVLELQAREGTPLADTIRSFEEIADGKWDHLPESAFMYVGPIEQAEEQAKKMQK